MNEAVDAIDPVHQCRVSKKECLDCAFMEEIQALLKVDKLQSVASCYMHGSLDERHCSEGAAELVYLGFA